MAYAYTNTIPGLVNTISQLRSVFPSQLTPETLKKWSIAPNNETYVLNVLRFLGIIDAEGKKVAEAAKAFVEHDDAAFSKRLEPLIRTAYGGLFESFGDAAWTLDRDRLISFFRVADDTSATVGTRQALTFQTLASLAGHGPPTETTRAAASRRRESGGSNRGRKRAESEGPRTESPAPSSGAESANAVLSGTVNGGTGVSLTLRIEINLPIAEDQQVYDRIFRSIRENLINE